MRRIVMCALALLVNSGVFFCGETQASIDDMKRQFDVSSLEEAYESALAVGGRDDLSLYMTGKTLSYLIEVRETLNGESAETEKMATDAIGYLRQALSGNSLQTIEVTDTYFLLAKLYNRLIREASSWMKYNADKEKYLQLCLRSDSAHRGARLISALALINLPANAGGNPEKGREALYALNDEYPDDTSIMMECAFDNLRQRKIGAVEEILTRVTVSNPSHPVAKRLLEDIAIMKREPTIHAIVIEGSPKTSEKRMLRKLSPFIGKTYSFEMKDSMGNSLREIPSIGGCSFTATEAEGNSVDLALTVNENNMRMFGLMGFAGVSFDFNKEIAFSGYPALLYMDQNFLGTADNLMLIFAGPYINLDYFHAGLIADTFPDIRIRWESMFLETETASVKDGKVAKGESIKSPAHSITLSFGKTFPIGFSAFVNMQTKYEDWSAVSGKTDRSFTVPPYHFSYSPSLDVDFSTVGGGMGSKLDVLSGFKVHLNGTLTYQQDYQDWGPSGDFYTHDAQPQWKATASAGYYFKVFDINNFRIDATYMTGGNMFRNTRWSAGKGTLMSSLACLDGYYAGEFSFTQGAMGSIADYITVIPTRLSVYAKYDVFLNADTMEMYSGTAIGVSAKLPYAIELTGQMGLGLNAQRENGPGVELDCMLSKMWFY